MSCKNTTETQFKTPAPFGVATKRFARIGFHPNLDVSGIYTKTSSKLGPGSYNLKYPGCQAKRGIRFKIEGSIFADFVTFYFISWDRKLELEDFSKFLNYKNVDILHNREFGKTLGGPATLGPDINLRKQKPSSVFQDSTFGLDERFKCYERDSLPPSSKFLIHFNKLF